MAGGCVWQGDVCDREGMHGGVAGRACMVGWSCMVGGMAEGDVCGRGACVAGGCVWQGDVCDREGMHGGGHPW